MHPVDELGIYLTATQFPRVFFAENERDAAYIIFLLSFYRVIFISVKNQDNHRAPIILFFDAARGLVK